MPKLGNVTTTQVFLPSTKDEADANARAWVSLKSALELGDLMALNDCTTDAQRAITLLTAIVKDWNYTEDGTDATPKLAINTDNINKLAPVDFMYLSEWVNEHMTDSLAGLSKDEKKTSSSTLIPVQDSPLQTT